jgi:isoleucyl-tRNA synthetase
VAGETVTLSEDDVLVQTESRGGTAVASDKGVTVAVDTELTPALVQEGYARDVVRQVNNMRKDAGLEISDRIELSYQGANGNVAAAMSNFADYVQQETLTVNLQVGPMTNPLYSQTVTIGDQDVTLQLRKALPPKPHRRGEATG